MLSRDHGISGLRLILNEAIDPTVATLCRQESDSLEAALSRWGRFRRPVQVCTVADRSALRQAAGASSSELLCALATLNTVTLLKPDMWATPPGHGDLYRAVLHELAHVLMFQRSTPDGRDAESALPVWFREGMAALVAEGEPSPALRRDVANRVDLLALAHADASMLARDSAGCYLVARLLFVSWIERFGGRRYAALCRSMRNEAGFALAHQRACGLDVDVFIGQWVDQVQKEARTG